MSEVFKSAAVLFATRPQKYIRGRVLSKARKIHSGVSPTTLLNFTEIQSARFGFNIRPPAAVEVFWFPSEATYI